MTDSVRSRLAVQPEVATALRNGIPVVALESTLVTHGLPHPENLEVAQGAESAVRAAGAVPATVAIRDGRLLVGLAPDELRSLAGSAGTDVLKAARPTLAAALAAPGWAGTTVSATMIAAAAAGIRVFATGGIGGVHRGAIGGGRPSLDISSDIEELARTPVVVVCAGPKAILDVAATMEVLETRGVPVVVVGQDEVPGFYSRRSGVRAPTSVPDLEAAAVLVKTHLDLGLGSGALVCVPVPDSEALADATAREAIEQAEADAERAGVRGPELTPYLLARIAEITGGASVRANRALIVNNAHTAAELGRLLG
jgi:pseudouridine-5'-phosphate glycosidase